MASSRTSRSAFALLATLVALIIGTAIGLGGFTFAYADGASYLQNDPAACANCHVMEEQYAGWLKSSHRAVATCNDCHTPDGLVGKYVTKADNGFWHSFYFTFNNFHEPIQIRDRNRAITEGACRGCHTELVDQMDSHHEGADKLSCIGCHGSVGHPR